MRTVDSLSTLILILAVSSLLVACQARHAHGGEPALVLQKDQASAFAKLALKGLSQEYPNKPEHVLGGPVGRAVAAGAPSRFFRKSTTGIRRCTATGCWCDCSAFFPTCTRHPRFERR